MNRDNRGPIPLWQLALYIAVLGVISMLLAPLTALWWIVPVLGAAIPIVLAVIQEREHRGAAADSAPVATPVADTSLPDIVTPPGPGQSDSRTIALSPDAGAAASTVLFTEPRSSLSEREMEVLALLAAGKTNAEAAEALFISVGTVKSHSANIYRKLEAKNRTEAVARAREFGLLE